MNSTPFVGQYGILNNKWGTSYMLLLLSIQLGAEKMFSDSLDDRSAANPLIAGFIRIIIIDGAAAWVNAV